MLSKEGMHRITIRVFSSPTSYSFECNSGLINIRSNLLSDSSEMGTKFIFDGDFDSIKDIDAFKMKFFNYFLDNFKVSIGSTIEMSKGSLIVSCDLNTDSTTMRNIFESSLENSGSILPGFNLRSIEQFDERYLPEVKPVAPGDLSKFPVGAIVGGVFAVLVIVAILAAIVFIIKMKKQSRHYKGKFKTF
jgi:hypothetical protein